MQCQQVKEGGRIKTTESAELHGGRIRKEGRKVVFHHLPLFPLRVLCVLRG
jgi:hypothetical protein